MKFKFMKTNSKRIITIKVNLSFFLFRCLISFLPNYSALGPVIYFVKKSLDITFEKTEF